MSDGTERDAYGVTVEKRHPRAILPERVADVGRQQVVIRGGGVVEGGILCGDLTVEDGPFTIGGSVLAMRSAQFRTRSGTGLVNGPTAARQSLLVEGYDRPSTAVRFIGDVSGGSVSLEGAVVYGNVMGASVSLRNCLVLGVCHASEHLRLHDTVCFRFLSAETEVHGRAYILDCVSTCGGKLDLIGRVWALPFVGWAESAGQRNAPAELTIDDVKQISGEREDGTVEKYWLLGLHDRIVDVSLATSDLAANVSWLEHQLSIVSAGEATEQTFGDIERPFWSRLGDGAPGVSVLPPGHGDASPA